MIINAYLNEVWHYNLEVCTMIPSSVVLDSIWMNKNSNQWTHNLNWLLIGRLYDLQDDLSKFNLDCVHWVALSTVAQRWHLSAVSHLFFKKSFSLTKNCRELLPGSYNCHELLPDSYNYCELFPDSYNCHKLVADGYNCRELLPNSYSCRELFWELFSLS